MLVHKSVFISSPFNPFSHELKGVNRNKFKEVIHIALIVDLEFGSAIVLLIHDCVPMSTTSPVRVGGEVLHECVGTFLSQYYNSAIPCHIALLDE